jgi:hypothetical protein
VFEAFKHVFFNRKGQTKNKMNYPNKEKKKKAKGPQL